MPTKKSAILAILLFAGWARPTLADDGPSKTEPESSKLDAYGDPLPPSAYARFGTVRFRHDTKAVAFLDDTTIVSVGSSIRHWDAATGKLIREYRNEQLADSDGATITADRKRIIAFCADGHYRIWDIGTGRMIGEIKAGGVWSRHEIRDDRAYFSASANGTRFVASECHIQPNRSVLERVAIYSTEAKDASVELRAEDFGTSERAISPDGACAVTAPCVTLADEQILRYWDARSGKKLRDDRPGLGHLYRLSFMPDGKTLILTGPNGIARRTPDGNDLWRQAGQSQYTDIVCVTNDRIVLRIQNGLTQQSEIRFLDAGSGKELGHWIAPTEGPAGAVSPDGKRLVYTVAQSLHVANLIDGKELVVTTGHFDEILQTYVTADGRFIASTDGMDSAVLIWDVGTGKLARRLEAGDFGCTCLALSPDGKLLASAVGGDALRVWETAGGKTIRKWGGTGDEPIRSLCFLTESQRLAIQSGNSLCVSIYDCQNGRELEDYVLRADAPFAGLIRQYDGRLLAVCRHPDAKPAQEQRWNGFDIWDVLARRVVRHVEGNSECSAQMVVSGDGRMLCVSGPDEIRLFELATGQVRTTLKNLSPKTPRFSLDAVGRSELKALAFAISRESSTIAVARVREPAVDFLDLPTGEKLGSLSGHDLPITTLEFTPDGRRLLTGSADTTILGWDLTRPKWRSRTLSSSLSEKDVVRHWERLRNGTAEEAYRSQWALVGDAKNTVEFLRTQLPSRVPVSAAQVSAWIADLDSDQYAVREKAQRQLQDRFDQAEELLRQRLASPLSAEARSRINRILDAGFAAIPQPILLRDLRAVEVLEQIGTPEARDVLRRLGKSDVPTAISRDAEQSLKRLEARPR